jgi:aminoglycoside phosphotransferase (APT) family kinase protein
MEAEANSHDTMKMIAWIEKELGGTVERCERQVRWRPGWFVDLRRDGELQPLYVRGDRNEEFPPWPLEYERNLLQLLQKTSIPVPKIFGFCPDPRAIILERLPGRPNLKTATNDEERLSVLEDLAHQMAAMHSLDIEPFRAIGLKMPTTPEERALPFFLEGEKLYLRYKSVADPRMEFVRRWIRRSVPEDREEVCFVHADPGQFLFQDGKITAMLDFEWACLGDPFMDLGGLRLRAIHEPMGDIAPLFRRYASLTGRVIDRNILGFHTVAFIANTSIAIAPAVASPNAGVDYPEYVNWYLVSLLFTLTCIAEIMGLDLHEPKEMEPAKPTRWAASFDVLASTFGTKSDSASPESEGSDAAYHRTLARSLAKFTRSLAFARDTLDADYVRAASELLGSSINGWQDADRALEEFVVKAGPESDETLLRIFHHWACRQLSLLEHLDGPKMWKLRVQPLAELVA